MSTAPPPSAAFAFHSPDLALAALLSRVAPVETERVPLHCAAGRVLAEDMTADRPSPACDVSAMDGYAIRESELRCGRIRVAGDIAIGCEAPPMPHSAALRIVTGAPVPAGTHAVIKREDCIEHEGAIELDDRAIAAATSGANIRRRGENCDAGSLVAPAGRLLTPAGIGALAAVGASSPLVRRRVRLAILVTGDEVLSPDSRPKPWQLRDSNGPALFSMFSVHPWIEVQSVAHVSDDQSATQAALNTAIEQADAVVCTGGVSMGQRDFVPDAAAHVGAEVVFHRLPQRPGKPALGAATASGKPILGLPGNPVSVLVTACRLAVPALRARAGLTTKAPTPLVQLVDTDNAALKLWWYRPVRFVGPSEVELVPTRGSGDIPSIATSDGFIEIAPGRSGPGPYAFYAWGG